MHWPGNNEGAWQILDQAVTCPPVYHTVEASCCPFNAERQTEKLRMLISIIFGLIQPGIESKAKVSVANAQFTQPLIGYSLTKNAFARNLKNFLNKIQISKSNTADMFSLFLSFFGLSFSKKKKRTRRKKTTKKQTDFKKQHRGQKSGR